MSVNVLGIGIIGFDGHIYEAMNKTGDEMLNILWSGMIIAGILYSVVTGNVSDISNAALDSSKEAVTLCITMLGVMAFWCGLMQIAEDAGLVEKMSGKMQPVIHFLFPQLPKNHPANKYITTNIIANILGLGWAATPAGLQAMEELAKLEESRRSLKGIASNEMCNFLILNISSLQLIPVSVIAYRSQYGSSNPSAITGAAIASTLVSTATAVIFCKIKEKMTKDTF